MNVSFVGNIPLQNGVRHFVQHYSPWLVWVMLGLSSGTRFHWCLCLRCCYRCLCCGSCCLHFSSTTFMLPLSMDLASTLCYFSRISNSVVDLWWFSLSSRLSVIAAHPSRACLCLSFSCGGWISECGFRALNKWIHCLDLETFAIFLLIAKFFVVVLRIHMLREHYASPGFFLRFDFTSK